MLQLVCEDLSLNIVCLTSTSQTLNGRFESSSFTRHGFEPQTQIVRIGTPDLLGTTVDPA